MVGKYVFKKEVIKVLTKEQTEKAEKMYINAQRYSAKFTIIMRKAKDAGITVSEAEIDEYIEIKNMVNGNGRNKQ